MIEPASTDALVGRVLGERYRIVRRIAAGGMGTVYLAQQESLRREVAVKDHITRPRSAPTVTMGLS